VETIPINIVWLARGHAQGKRNKRYRNVNRTAFAEADSAIPFDVLANYLAGAQVALVQWWLEKRRPHPPENLAQAFHRLQRTAIRDTLSEM
jgi:hypothetical protein